MPENAQFKILDDLEWQKLNQCVDWFHSEIREMYFTFNSGSPFQRGSLLWFAYFMDSKGAKMLQFNFDGLNYFSQDIDYDTDPSFKASDAGMKVLNFPILGLILRAGEIRYRLFEVDPICYRQQLGHEIFSDEQTEEAVSLGEAWRQCSACMDAWQENPATVIARCPNCGQLTHLVKASMESI